MVWFRPPDLRDAGHFIEEAQGHGGRLLHQGTQGVDGQVAKGRHTLAGAFHAGNGWGACWDDWDYHS